MRIVTEQSLPWFKFWSGAEELAKKLSYSQLEDIECALDDLYPEGMTDGELNDLFWFDSDFVLSLIGLKEDENGELIEADEE